MPSMHPFLPLIGSTLSPYLACALVPSLGHGISLIIVSLSHRLWCHMVPFICHCCIVYGATLGQGLWCLMMYSYSIVFGATLGHDNHWIVVEKEDVSWWSRTPVYLTKAQRVNLWATEALVSAIDFRCLVSWEVVRLQGLCLLFRFLPPRSDNSFESQPHCETDALLLSIVSLPSKSYQWRMV